MSRTELEDLQAELERCERRLTALAKDKDSLIDICSDQATELKQLKNSATLAEVCKAIFKIVPQDQAYDLLNDLTHWHEEGRYE